MDANSMFITTLTEKTGITYETIRKVYKESGSSSREALCQIFMDKFQMSFGFANTLAEIMIESHN